MKNKNHKKQNHTYQNMTYLLFFALTTLFGKLIVRFEGRGGTMYLLVLHKGANETQVVWFV